MLTSRLLLLALSTVIATALLTEAASAEDHPAVALVKSKVKDPAKPFAMFVTIKTKPGKEKELEAAFAPCIAATKKEAGCLAYELNHDPDESTSYIMFEKFKDVAALETHVKSEHVKKLFEAIGPLTDGEVKAKVYLVPE